VLSIFYVCQNENIDITLGFRKFDSSGIYKVFLGYPVQLFIIAGFQMDMKKAKLLRFCSKYSSHFKLRI